MAFVFKRIFNVRSNEYAVFAAFFAFYFLIGIQFSIGLAVSEALFLAEVGPGFLPYMYIFNAFVIIFISMIYTSFTDKFSIPAMFKIVLFFFTGLVLIVRFGITADIRAWGMPVAFPFLHTLFVMFTNLVPNNFRAFYGLYLDVLQAKRLVPIILTGGRYGGIVGGFSIPLLVSLIGSVANLLYVWIGAIFASIFLIAVIQIRLRDYLLESPETARKKGGAKPPARNRGSLNLLKTNRYVAAFATFTFLVVFLRSFQDYQYSVVFREVFQDRAQLASFLGLFTGMASVVALLIQTFITPRLIRRLGLGTANLLYPLTTLVGLAGMMISPAFYSAVFLRFNNKNLQESIRNPINALLYNALPTNIRSRVGAIMAGQVIAVASILSGIILLIIKPTGLALLPLSPRWLAFFSFLIAIGYISAGFLLRREYGAALRKMLEDRNLGLFQFAQEGFGAIDQESLAILVKNVHEGDGDLCIYAAGMLVETDHPGAVDEILSEIPRRGVTTRCALIRLLAQTKTGKEDERVRALWAKFIRSDEPETQCAVMDAIANAQLIDEYVEQIQECLNSPAPIVRARAVHLLVRSDDLFWLAAGLQTLHAMLETGQSDEKICALQCIGELGNPRFVRRIIPYLCEADVAVREAAMEAAERLIPAHATGEKQLEEVIQTALKDPQSAIRRRGIRFLGKRGTRANFERLLAALSDPDSTVRHEAVESLKEMKGRGTLTLEGGALFALLGRWLTPARNGDSTEVGDDEIVEGLTEFSLEHLREIYEIINHLHTIEQIGEGNSFVMLRKVLRDKVHERQGLILELLGVIGDEKTVDTVSESLARGERTSRAIAIETLSNVTAVGDIRQLILMLEPLLLGGTTSEILTEGRKSWDLFPIEFGRVLQIHMGSLEPWTRAVAVNAAGHFLAEDESILLAEEGTIEKNRKGWIGRFQTLTRDEDFYVREAAVMAMGLMRTHEETDLKVLESALSDPENRVRLQAQRAIKRIESLKSTAGQPTAENTEREMLSTTEKALFLRSVTLFESMTADQLKILSNISKEIHFSPGVVLFEEGEPCDYLYVIVDGEIEIVRAPGTAGENILAILKHPSSFGELALFRNEGRSAAARARNDVILLGIEKDPLLVLVQEHPEISVAIIFQLTSIIRSQDEARAASVQRTQEN